VALVVLAVHRRLHCPDDISLKTPWLLNDGPAHSQVTPLPGGQRIVVLADQAVFTGHDRRGVHPSVSHRSEARPNRKVDEATLPPMC
jgi:hypothetical protein